MTAQWMVFAIALAVIGVAIGLVVAGVAVLAGTGWALITAGVLVAVAAVVSAVVLLHDSDKAKP